MADSENRAPVPSKGGTLPLLGGSIDSTGHVKGNILGPAGQWDYQSKEPFYSPLLGGIQDFYDQLRNPQPTPIPTPSISPQPNQPSPPVYGPTSDAGGDGAQTASASTYPKPNLGPSGDLSQYASDFFGSDQPTMLAPMAYAADIPSMPTLLTADDYSDAA